MTSGRTNFNSWMAVQSKSRFQAGSLKKGSDWQKKGRQHRNEEIDEGQSCAKQSCPLLITIQPDEPQVTPLKSPRGGSLFSVTPRVRSSRRAFNEPPDRTRIQACLSSSSRCCPHFSCKTLRRGAQMSSTRWTAPTDATRSGAAARSGAHGRSWMTAAVARSVQPGEGSTATAQCPACTGWSADRDYFVSSIRMRTIMETNMGSAKVCWHSAL